MLYLSHFCEVHALMFKAIIKTVKGLGLIA